MCSGDGTGYFTTEEPQTQNPHFFKVIEVESKWSEGRSLGVRKSWVEEENRALTKTTNKAVSAGSPSATNPSQKEQREACDHV